MRNDAKYRVSKYSHCVCISFCSTKYESFGLKFHTHKFQFALIVQLKIQQNSYVSLSSLLLLLSLKRMKISLESFACCWTFFVQLPVRKFHLVEDSWHNTQRDKTKVLKTSKRWLLWLRMSPCVCLLLLLFDDCLTYPSQHFNFYNINWISTLCLHSFFHFN